MTTSSMVKSTYALFNDQLYNHQPPNPQFGNLGPSHNSC